jgi:hypothetical protein
MLAMVDSRATLYGGPRDREVVAVDGIPFGRLVLPRYREDMTLVMDVYEFCGTSFAPRSEPHPFSYVGEEIPPKPDPALLALTRRERFRDWLGVVRRGWW